MISGNAFAKLVLGQKYKNYENALEKLNLYSLSLRRKNLCLKFAQSGLRNCTLTDLLCKNKKNHKMKTRKFEEYNTDFSNTARLDKSTIPYMQRLLNESN